MEANPQQYLKTDEIDPNSPLFKKAYSEEDKEMLSLIIQTLRRKTKCEICGGSVDTEGITGN